MANYNKIILVGHLGKDPEIKFLDGGTTVANFSIATSFKRGENQITTWYNVSVFGKTAEAVNKYLSKGSKVLVEGRHQLREYQNKEGNKQFANEVVASDVSFLDSANERTGAAVAAKGAEAPINLDDDDIPF